MLTVIMERLAITLLINNTNADICLDLADVRSSLIADL